MIAAGESLKNVWGESGDSLERVWRESGESLERVWILQMAAEDCQRTFEESLMRAEGLLMMIWRLSESCLMRAEDS